MLRDPEALPETAAYLRALPAGLASYPECEVRTEVNRVVFKRFPAAMTHPALSEELQTRLRASVDDEWNSDVLGNVVRLLVRDVVCTSDEDYDRWSFEIAGEVFRRPLYKMLMYVLSPSLVVMGASRRWSTFRRGTELETHVRGRSASAELSFPPRLYPLPVLRSFGQAYRASLVAARARECRIELVEAGEDFARWDLSWV